MENTYKPLRVVDLSWFGEYSGRFGATTRSVVEHKLGNVTIVH
jgi:hypothetical protein